MKNVALNRPDMNFKCVSEIRVPASLKTCIIWEITTVLSALEKNDFTFVFTLTLAAEIK